MKVVHLDHTESPGGAELALARLLSGGPTWSPSLVLPGASGPAHDGPFDRVDESIPVLRVGPIHDAGLTSSKSAVKTARMVGRILATAVSIRRLHAVKHADLVHANTSRSALYASLALVGTKVPLVVHLRDLVDRDSLGGVGYHVMTKFVLPRATGVIANSEATLATAMRFISTRAYSGVVPSPIGAIAERPVARPGEDGAPTSGAAPVRIGMVARLAPWKGQALLVSAFIDALRDHAPAELHLAGAPLFGHDDYLAELRATVDGAGLRDRVHFAGHVEDVSSFINAMDICVQCSLRPEPLGQNVLQYLAHGKAVIVANQGGPVEWVVDGANGLHFRQGDSMDLASQLRRLIDDPELRKRLAADALLTRSVPADHDVIDMISTAFRATIATSTR